MSNYELRYIKTGTVPGREDLLYQGGDLQKVRQGPVYLFYVKFEKGVVLVDSSFHMDDAKIIGAKKNVTRKLPEEDPLYALKQVGIKPQDVSHLILTHAHFDHIGYVDAFPNAKIFVHRKELAWVIALPKWSVGYGSFCLDKLYKARNQIVPIDMDVYEIIPGIETVYAGGHSAGSLAVVVSTKKGRACLCGDNCFLYKTIEEKLPIGLTNNLYESMTFLEKLSSLGEILIPGHDPKVYELFPNGLIA
jgi:glyoxylase-like metal-dependent hydrolase (beta-lactamase superfamily II)